MRVLFVVGLSCLLLVFFSKLDNAFSGRPIDVILAIELGLLLILYVVKRLYSASNVGIAFVVLSIANIFYFSYVGFYYPLGGWLFSVINTLIYMILFGLPVIWIAVFEKQQRKESRAS